MTITIRLRRPARRSVALTVGAMLLLTPAVVVASHQFTDVYNTTPFHNEIGAIAKAGITGGFPGNQYRPSEPVTRQAMAAFMHRGFGRVGFAASGLPDTDSVVVPAGEPFGNAVVVRRIKITVPGASNSFTPNQLVQLHGQVALGSAMGPLKGCPCQFTAFIREQGASPAAYQSNTFYEAGDRIFQYSFGIQALVPATPGVHTYELLVALTSRADLTNEASFLIGVDSSLSAATFPFGPTGGNTP